MPQDMRDIVLILQHDSVSWAKLGKDLLWMIFHFPGGYPTLSTSYLSTGSSLYSRMQNDVWALPVQKATKLQTYSHPCETGNTWRWVAASLGCCRLQWVLEWLEPSPAEEAVLMEPWMVPRAESGLHLWGWITAGSSCPACWHSERKCWLCLFLGYSSKSPLSPEQLHFSDCVVIRGQRLLSKPSPVFWLELCLFTLSLELISEAKYAIKPIYYIPGFSNPWADTICAAVRISDYAARL